MIDFHVRKIKCLCKNQTRLRIIAAAVELGNYSLFKHAARSIRCGNIILPAIFHYHLRKRAGFTKLSQNRLAASPLKLPSAVEMDFPCRNYILIYMSTFRLKDSLSLKGGFMSFGGPKSDFSASPMSDFQYFKW